jgi:hypothetical protein
LGFWNADVGLMGGGHGFTPQSEFSNPQLFDGRV